MDVWAVVALCAVSLYTGMLVVACVATGRWADDNLKSLAPQGRVAMFGLDQDRGSGNAP